ncbi:MAG: hypothetical protein HC837_06180 [Chloroflexaceae bacterium]|nr:hypothetical protein [Chloroflexaceae bacterium]
MERTAFSDQVYVSSADVAVMGLSTDVLLDNSVKTTVLSVRTVGSDTLLALTHSSIVAEAVAKQLEAQGAGEQNPLRLLSRIQTSFVGAEDVLEDGQKVNTNLIRITATDPDQERAALLANAWADAYTNLINDLYGTIPNSSKTEVQANVEQARQTYEDAQDALIAFREQSRLDELQREISDKRYTLSLLNQARTTVLSSTMISSIDAQTQFYNAQVAATLDNQLLAFEKELERKRLLLSGYIDEQTAARLDSFLSQAQERRQTLKNAYAQKQEFENFLSDARILREQARQGGDAESTTLALTLLKARIVGSQDLNFDSLAGIEAFTPANIVADTEALVAALEAELLEVDAVIAEQRQLLMNDAGLDLTQAPDDTELTRLITQQYPELFESGELGQLSQTQVVTDSLAQSAQTLQQNLSLIENDVENLLDMSSGTFLNQTIMTFEQDLRELQAALEREKGKEENLVLERTLAFQAYTLLSRKLAEFDVADSLPNIEVSVVSRALIPNRQVSESTITSSVETTGRGLQLPPLVLAVLVGLVIGLMAAYLLDYLGPESVPQNLVGKPDAWWNRAFRWVVKPARLRRRERDGANQAIEQPFDHPGHDDPESPPDESQKP